MYKLIAIDLDNTLLNSYGKISHKNKKAIKRAKKNGIEVIIASGRHITSVKSFANQIKCDKYAICGNGATLYDIQNNKVLYNCFIGKEKILEIINICEENNIYYNVYTETEILTKEIKYSALYYEQENKNKKSNYKTNIKVIENVYEFVKNDQENNYLKVTVYNDDKEIFKSMIQLLRAINGISVLDVGHISKKIVKIDNKDVEIKYYYTEITKENVNKWNTIEYLIKCLGISKEEVVAIGDNVNDKEMIENAGLGVVMGNSAQYIKEFGDIVVSDNNSDGVSEAIIKYVLKE